MTFLQVPLYTFVLKRRALEQPRCAETNDSTYHSNGEPAGLQQNNSRVLPPYTQSFPHTALCIVALKCVLAWASNPWASAEYLQRRNVKAARSVATPIL